MSDFTYTVRRNYLYEQQSSAPNFSQDWFESPGYIWLAICTAGTLFLYWYNKRVKLSRVQVPNVEIKKIQCPVTRPTTAEDIAKQKEFNEKRKESVEKLQIEHKRLSSIQAERRKQRMLVDLNKKLETIEYLNSICPPSRNPSPDPNSKNKSDGCKSSTFETSSSAPPAIMPRNDVLQNNAQEPEDFISDFEFEFYTLLRNGGSISNLVCSAGINGITREIIVDTGASFTIIHERLAQSGKLQKIPNDLRLCGAGGEQLEILGAMKVTISIGDGFSVQHNALVSVNLSVNVLLGCDFHSRHGLSLDFATNTLKFSNGSLVKFNVYSL